MIELSKQSLGTKLKKGTGVGVITIAGLTSIDGLDVTADTLDVTTLLSPDGWREFEGSLKDGGEVSIGGYLDPEEGKGQKELYDALGGEAEPYTIEFPSKLGVKWDFNAVVTGIKTGVNLGDPLSFEATLKVSGKPDLALTPAP